MQKFTYTIQDALGIHARPAGLLAKQAAAFQSKVELTGEGKTCDAKKVMAVMMMGVKQGQQLTFTIEGVDEKEAAEALERFMRESL